MGRMLDALKNLDNDPGATMAVPAPVVVRPTQVPTRVQPQTPPPATNPGGPETIGNVFLSKLASSSRPAGEAELQATPNQTIPSTSVVSAAAAALAKLKSASAANRPHDPAVTSPQLAATQAVAPNWGNPVAQPPIAPPPYGAPPAATAAVAPPVSPAIEAPQPTPAVAASASETPPNQQAEIALPSPRPTTTRLEESVKAALADPRRSVPLEQLARRMRSELRADAGRCWLLADAGQHNDSTELAAHLGAIFASQLGDVLLVDGNLECALLSAGMNVINRPGIAQTAMNGAKSWQNLIQPTAWEHLFLLPAGQMMADMPDPTAAWTEVLAQAERRFRLVLVDGGPATEAACKVFGRLCDATFVVVRLGLTEAREARQAMKQLRSSGARVIGSIATSVPTL